jgi:hypothetical protein
MTTRCKSNHSYEGVQKDKTIVHLALLLISLVSVVLRKRLGASGILPLFT